MAGPPIYLFVIGIVLCVGFSVLLRVGGGLLIFYLGKNEGYSGFVPDSLEVAWDD
jgi:hypothetical protein